MIFAASRSVPYMAYIAHVVSGVWCGKVGIFDARVCESFVSSTSGIVFNPSIDAITDHSQSAKDTDPYLSPSFVEDPGQKRIIIYFGN